MNVVLDTIHALRSVHGRFSTRPEHADQVRAFQESLAGTGFWWRQR